MYKKELRKEIRKEFKKPRIPKTIFEGKKFELFFPCPLGCDNKECKHWSHGTCGNSANIDVQGMISCSGTLCNEFFIKDAGFKCGSENHQTEYAKYERLSDFQLAVACVTRTVEEKSKAVEMDLEFLEKLYENVKTKWYKKIT